MDKKTLAKIALKHKEDNLIRLGEKYKNAELDLFLFRIELEQDLKRTDLRKN